MSTCEENDDLLNIFNLISDIKEDLKKLKALEIPSDENGITELKVREAFIKTKKKKDDICHQNVSKCHLFKSCV